MLNADERRLRRFIGLIAGGVACAIAIGAPLGYFLTAYQYESARIARETKFDAAVLSELIYSNPVLWRFEEHRLTESIERRLPRDSAQSRRILDLQNQVIAQRGDTAAGPSIVQRMPLYDGDHAVAELEVSEPLIPILARTGAVAGVSILMAVLIYIAVRLLPFRALLRALEHLEISQNALREEIFAKELALKKAEDMGSAMRHQALHDHLTQLPNRALFNDRVQYAIQAAQRAGDMVAVAMIDLDRFKEINDTLGHQAGDLVLQEVALRLQNQLRKDDTIARLGGDEFVVLLPIEDINGAITAARKALHALDRPMVVGGHELEISASLGLAIHPQHGADSASLLKNADIAMYTAKRRRSGYAVYEAAEDAHTAERLGTVAELRRAMEKHELILHYQPSVDLASGQINRLEALVRWQHPRRGLLYADDFVSIAEESGLIKSMTLYIIDAALAQCRIWHDDGITLPLAINVSAINLHDPKFVQRTIKLIERHGLTPNVLEFELTESALMLDQRRGLENIKALSHYGITIAIDDFGTGYSSMTRLRQLPVRTLKIDKSFVMEMLVNENDAAIVRSTIALAHSLGLHTVAEGVESRAIAHELERLHCDSAQGYYITRPLAPDDLERWLRLSPWAAQARTFYDSRTA